MLTLRLTQHAESTPGKYRIGVRLEGAGAPRTTEAPLEFAMSAQDQEDLRWYLEDYLQFPLDPAPQIAARVEERMAEIGDTLFRAVFHANDDARDLWAKLRDDLADPEKATRVEIVTDARHAAAVPWELMRDPKTKAPLALRARSFVRGHSTGAVTPRTERETGGPIRILLVICRPGGDDDVPFRSVATRLLKGLDKAAREVVQLDLLRPPTFEQLASVLRNAARVGKPYHVVHFDGHGAYVDAAEVKLSEALAGRRCGVLHRPHPHATRRGTHGHLVFEATKGTSAGAESGSASDDLDDSGDLVDGPTLGKLLVETGVPLLVLNACRSSYAEPPTAPVTQDAAPAGASTGAKAPEDVASFGSLALDVMDAGVTGVVAMRYNVYVVTAAMLVFSLYSSLADGTSLGEAVTRGRKQLAAQPIRDVPFGPTAIADWPVPVVHEAAEIPLFPAPTSKRTLHFTVGPKGKGNRNGSENGDRDDNPPGGEERGRLVNVPPRPDAGFFGRDETLLRLDRAFDRHPVVLLHAYAGSGKSSVSAEFARWYSRTGGVEGPVVWTSFEQRKTLPQVLDTLGQVFEPDLAKSGVHWLALEEPERRSVALQILQQVPLLWIWDNVEPVAGFPAGTESAWSPAEQNDLADFLRDARDTKARFLLTSRRDERRWLGDLPVRVKVPPMPGQERVEFAKALAERRGAAFGDVKHWRPLLAFTQGNPLAITVLVGQALRDGLRGEKAVAAFVEKLRAGEAAFEDETTEGRSRSLGASLSYGFESAFSERERKQLALLHLFQGFVNVDVLRAMGAPEADWCLAEVRGLTREAGIALLDKAAEIGLLSPYGGRYYSIHPALPWYFRGLFEKHYPAGSEDGGGGGPAAATRAFVEAMGELGNLYHNRYEEGHRDVVAALQAEEPNLLYARAVARRFGWWKPVISTMQGLDQLYDHTGRRLEWAQRVAEIVPDFVDPATDGPIPGREESWGPVNGYRVRLARNSRQWSEAARLQRNSVEWSRKRAAPALATATGTLDAGQKSRIHSLATAVHGLAEVRRELGEPECIALYEEAAGLAERIGDRSGQATVAFNLGHVYKDIPSVRDLSKAEEWYRRSLALRPEDQPHVRAQCLNQLGLVALQRFEEARKASRPETELLDALNSALRFHHQALELLPPNAVSSLAVTHNQLGVIYERAGDVGRALGHYQESVRYEELQGNLFGAAQTRFNVALLLAQAGRLADARAYARTALRNYETFGDRADAQIQQTQQLLAAIEHHLQNPPTS